MILVRNVPTSLKGELSRWLMEPLPGVFLGHVSAIVRDALWDKCREKCGKGGCILLYPWPSEQGFRAFTYGNLPRDIVDHEGLYLVRKPLEKGSNA
jgi:CRISPR-associated protein Cas2